MRFLPGMLMLVLMMAAPARATTDVMPFRNEAQEQQFRQLTERCAARNARTTALRTRTR